jgi:hypothetical protein
VSTDPTLKSGHIDKMFGALGELHVDLDNDPLAYGPKRLNGKIAKARKMLGRCEEIFLQISHDLSRFTRALRVAELEVQLKRDDLFANDPHVRAGRNVADREALANVRLRAEVKRVAALKDGEDELRQVLTVVKSKRADLRDAAGRLRDQIRLCQEEIVLGSKWGSKVPNAPDIKPSGTPDLSAIDNLVSSAGEETHLPALPEWKGDSDTQFQSPVHPDTVEDDKAGAIATPLEPASLCSACGEPQRDTPSGKVCKNGHGGAPSADPEPEAPAPEPEPAPEPAPPEPKPEPVALDEGEEAVAAEVLPGTATEDEVAAFLDAEEPAAKKPRDLDEDLGDLLAMFGE